MTAIQSFSRTTALGHWLRRCGSPPQSSLRFRLQSGPAAPTLARSEDRAPRRSSFCREELMARCEANAVDYALGLAPNQRLARIIGRPMHEARRLHQSTGKAARLFTEFPTRRAAAGRGLAGLWLRRNIWTKARTPASWSPRCRPNYGMRKICTRSSTAPAARWRTASRNRVENRLVHARTPKGSTTKFSECTDHSLCTQSF